MIKNKKIARYMEEKQVLMVDEVKIYLNFFIENYDEFEKVIESRENFSLGNGMEKYERLSLYIAKRHKLAWRNGENIPPALVRNLLKLSRRERESRKLKNLRAPELNTVFKVYQPEDSIE